MSIRTPGPAFFETTLIDAHPQLPYIEIYLQPTPAGIAPGLAWREHTTQLETGRDDISANLQWHAVAYSYRYRTPTSDWVAVMEAWSLDPNPHAVLKARLPMIQTQLERLVHNAPAGTSGSY